MQFSERMAHIKPSATLTINAKALELKSQGVDVTSLAIGEPNFPTPAHVCDAAKQAIDEGFTRYTAVPRIPPLRASSPCTTCSPPCSMTATKCSSPRRTG